MKTNTTLGRWRSELAAGNVRSALAVTRNHHRPDRRCGASGYCNSMIAGGAVGPRCPWCDRVETAMAAAKGTK